MGPYSPHLIRHARVTGRVIVLLLAAATVVTAAALYVNGGSFALERLASADIPTHSDWGTFYASAHALLHGQGLYAADPSLLPNLNPPLLSVLLAPIALLDVLQGYRVWVLLSAILVAASLTAVAAELRLRAAVAVPVVGPRSCRPRCSPPSASARSTRC